MQMTSTANSWMAASHDFSDVNSTVIAPASMMAACRQRFAGRSIRAADGLDSLSRCLTTIPYGDVLYVAPWKTLTTEVSRVLAEWVATVEGRGCGVWPAASPSPTPWIKALRTEVVASGSMGSWRLTPRSMEPVDEAALFDAMDSEAPILGLSLTGHGDEQCVGFGQNWISTTADANLPGVARSPSALHAAVIFLNTCGVMRLGDATAPRGQLLVERLARSGAAVIGAFRNTTVLPELPAIFAHELLAGRSLGGTVGRLNHRLVECGREPPSFMLLGDPSRCWPAASSSAYEVRRASSDLGPVRRVTERFEWLFELDGIMRRWGLHDPVREPALRLYDLAPLVFPLTDASLESAVDDAALETAVSEASRAAADYETTALEAIAAVIQQGCWIQARYGPVSRCSRHPDETCVSCGSRLVRYEYEPHGGSSACTVWCKECDRCGTMADGIGEATSNSSLAATWDGETLNVSVPALEDGERGLVVLHRGGELPPRPWPTAGETVRFHMHEFSLRGRTTIAGLRLAHRRLRMDYTTVHILTTPSP